MNICRRLYFIPLFFSLIVFPSSSFASRESPAIFVKSIVDQFINIVKSENNEDVKKEKILNLMKASFDFPHITEVLLRGLEIKDNDNTIFIDLFPSLLQMRYSIFVKSPGSLTVEYSRYEVFAGEMNAIVYTRTKIPPHDMALNYKLHHVDGNWKIQDITVGGISLVVNYRAQIHQVLKRKSFSDFLFDLEKMVKRNSFN